MPAFKLNFQFSKVFCVYFLVCLFCSSCVTPIHHFGKKNIPEAPDYSRTRCWAALPEIKDSADAVPYGTTLEDLQSQAQVDVFYIHPTVDYSGKGWNADLNNKRINKRTDIYPVRFQASAFNGSCKVYAPRYRQATLYSFTKSAGENGIQALELAYTDVCVAFQYYLQHYNKGRPFIIASHSQGSRHAYRLLNDYFQNNPPLIHQLVAAYIIGLRTDSVFTFLPACTNENQTGCIISWNTYKWGAKSNNYYLGANRYCTNPLSWKNDTTYCSKAMNLGGIPRSFDRIDTEICDAKIEDGLLWIHKPKRNGYFRIGKNFHMSDYQLFYMNIRQNVKTRIDAYWERIN